MYYYVYRITCTHPNSIEKYYYGYRSCSVLPEEDNYWSSSKYILNAINQYGSSFFKKKILKVFFSREEALKYEILLHEKFGVDKNKLFFNRSKQTIWGVNCTGVLNKGKTYEEILGKERAIELKKLRSKNAKGKNNSGKNNPMYGKKQKEEVKLKHSARMKGVNHPTYGFTWITNGVDNKKVDLNTYDIDENWYIGRTMNMLKVPKEKFQCPYCFKMFSLVNLNRWHGDNCKSLKDRFKEILV
jgi:hypothetical protein